MLGAPHGNRLFYNTEEKCITFLDLWCQVRYREEEIFSKAE